MTKQEQLDAMQKQLDALMANYGANQMIFLAFCFALIDTHPEPKALQKVFVDYAKNLEGFGPKGRASEQFQLELDVCYSGLMSQIQQRVQRDDADSPD